MILCWLGSLRCNSVDKLMDEKGRIDMKKKLLIINKSFELGGIQMSLANLLEAISDECDISLAVFNPRGPMLERVPDNVKLIELAPLTEVLGMTNSDCKKFGSVTQRAFKVIGTLWSKIFGNTLPVAFALLFQKNVGDFDVVISYHQEPPSTTLVAGFGKFALEKCNAKKRIAWVHADYLATKLANRKNFRIYKKFDQIISVSKTAIENFAVSYPSLRNKCDYCYNCIPVEDIIEKSKMQENVFDKGQDDVVLFSASRLVVEKGLAPALKDLAPLFSKYKNLKWYIAGIGPEESLLRNLITKYKLDSQVFLLGFKQNPYPYIKEADYLLLPSLHETFSMVAREAAVFGTPVIASDIPIMREVLGEGGVLCSNGDYATKVEKLLLERGNGNVKYSTKELSDWKEQFERIIQW